MLIIKDLNIEKELFPLLDYTRNDFSKAILLSMLSQPLATLEEKINRQDILKAFIANHAVLSKYAYSRVDLHEVYALFSRSNYSEHAKRISTIDLFFSDQKRQKFTSSIIQLILLFHRLEQNYFARINLKVFPSEYQNELSFITNFLSRLVLGKYESLIREQKIRTKHLVHFHTLLQSQINEKQADLFWEKFFLFEAYLSLSTSFKALNWQFPEFSKREFSLSDFYHPLLKTPVKNSIATSKNVVLLSGPNMSGKSTCLKAISLCIYLGNIGLAIPAAKAMIPNTQSTLIAINLNDDLQNGYSHFMSEILNLKKILLEALDQKRCFASFDELFRSTNNEEALSITEETIVGLLKFTNSLFFISTHLQELQAIPAVTTGQIAAYHIECLLDGDQANFTYQLKEGWSDLRIARLLFEKEGINNLLHQTITYPVKINPLK